jgi:hypothetical protein
MNARFFNLNSMCTLTLMGALAVPVFGQVAGPEKPAPPAPAPPASAGEEKPEEKKPSSLDDLLGLEEDKTQSNEEDAATREAEDELNRELNEAEIADRFQLAVKKMSISAELLDTQFDPGLGTQRVQEDIIAKLAQLIDAAKRNQCKAGSSSSSSSSQSAQQPKNGKNNPGQKPQNQNQAQNQNQPNRPQTNTQEMDPPGMQQGDINTVLEESRTEWGNLPQRVRDALSQGKRDKYSSLYQQLTGEYYKRLAEDNK